MPQMDFALEQERIARNRKIAEALLAQSQQPMGDTQVINGIAVQRSPLEGIAKVVQAYMASQGMNKADTEAKALGQRQKDDVAEAIAEYQRKITARPGSSETIIDEQANGGEGAVANINTPAMVPGQQERMAAAMELAARTGGDAAMPAKMLVADALKPKEIKAYKPGDVLMQDGVQVGKIPEKPAEQPSAVREYEFAKAQGFQGTFEQWQLAQRRASATNVTFGQEKEEAKTVGKGFGEQYIEVQKAGLAANTKLANLDRMQGLLEGVTTGKLTPVGTELASYAKSLGFNIDEKLGNKQAIDALSKEMALQLRNPSGGAGMPGALSDQDRRFLEAMVAGLGKDPQANKLIIDGMRGLAKRDKEVAQLARDYRRKKGQLDEGFFDELDKFSKSNPLFSQATGTSGGLVKNADGTYTYTPGGR